MDALTKTLFWASDNIAGVVVVGGLCWLVIAPVYIPLMSKKSSLAKALVTLSIIILTYGFGRWVFLHDPAMISGEGYIFLFLAFPFTVGWTLNWIVGFVRRI